MDILTICPLLAIGPVPFLMSSNTVPPGSVFLFACLLYNTRSPCYTISLHVKFENYRIIHI